MPRRRHRLLTSGGGSPSSSFLLSSLLATSLAPDDPLVIGVGTTITVDLAMIDGDRLGTITNNGTLAFATGIDTRLLCASIINYGTILAGTSGVPHPKNITIDLCGARPTVNGFTAGERTALGIGSALITGPTHTINVSTGNNGVQNDNNGVSRAFINDAGGRLEMYGSQAPAVRRLNAHYASGATITVDSAVTAPAGSTVLVTPTGFYNAGTRTEVRTLAVAAVATTTLTLSSALGFARWGVMQYYTDSGPATAPGTFSQISGGNPTGMRTHVDQNPQLDERAFVVVLSPTIKIKGYDSGNTDLATFGYGMHGMTMGLTSKTVLKNVGFENYGQKGLLGRYGWHFHMPSYNADGTNKTDGAAGTNKYTAGWALLDGVTGLAGQNRFVTLHGCRGVVVQNCVGHDALGHAFFEEDGSEEENTLHNNVAIAYRVPAAGDRLKVHDATPAGFWFASPNNTHTDNWAIDSAGLGWWNAHSKGIMATRPSIQHGCLGSSALVPINPFFGKLGTWSGNSALCVGDFGGKSNNAVGDNAGNLGPNEKIRCTTDGVAYATFNSLATDVALRLENVRMFKCQGYSNVVATPDYLNWRMADIDGVGFSGITDPIGFANNALMARESLNHESSFLADRLCNAIIPYHGTLVFPNLSAWGYSGGTPAANTAHHTLVENTCVQQSWEEYTVPIHTYSSLNSGWAIGASNSMWQTPPAHLTELVTTYDAITGVAAGGPKFMDITNGTHRRWTFGIQYDHWGMFMKGPTTGPQPNCHIVFNQPYFTTGLTVTALENNPQSCWTLTPFHGLEILPGAAGGTPGTGGYDRSEMPHKFQRVNSARANIAGAVWEMPISLSNGNVPPDYGSFFNDDHHGVCPIGGYVVLTFPGVTKPNTFLMGNQSSSGNGGNSPWKAVNPNLAITDCTTWGIEFDGSTPVVGGYVNSATGLTGVASLAALDAHAGNCYWHDTGANMCWIKIKDLYDGYQWRIYASGYAT